jgi:hypothetical protein
VRLRRTILGGRPPVEQQEAIVAVEQKALRQGIVEDTRGGAVLVGKVQRLPQADEQIHAIARAVSGAPAAAARARRPATRSSGCELRR